MRQLDLLTDLPRGEQLSLLRRVEIPPYELPNGRRVTSCTLKAVLRAIDDFDNQDRGCFASQATIAAAVGCSRRTLQAAIAGLLSMDLITCDRSGIASTNQHRIVWTSLHQLGAKQSRHEAQPRRIPCATVAHGGATVAPQRRDHNAGGAQPSRTIRNPNESRNVYGPKDQRDDLERVEVSADQIAPRVALLFDRLGYIGDAGGTLWMAIAAIDAGVLSASDIGRSIEAVKASETKPRDIIAFFRTVLAEKAGMSLEELKAAFSRIRVTPRLPTTRPNIASVAAPCKSPPRAMSDAEAQRKRQEIVSQLDAIPILL